MVEDDDAVFAWARGTGQKWSDGQWETARMLVEMERTGRWRARYITWDEFVIKEVKIFPGMARELMRVQKKLDLLEIEPETASDVGYIKVRTVAAKMQADNVETIVKDLETENVLTVRQKYCPRSANPRARETNCGPRATACIEPSNRAECGPIPPEMAKAAAVTMKGSTRITTVDLKRKPGELYWTDKLGQKHSVGPFVDVTANMIDAVHVARRYWGAYTDQDCIDGVCAMFVIAAGTVPEQDAILDRLRAERDRRGEPRWVFDSPSKVPEGAKVPEGVGPQNAGLEKVGPAGSPSR